MATRCRCPPESSSGLWCRYGFEPHLLGQRSSTRLRSALRLSGVLPHRAGELDVLGHVEHGDEVEVLEDEADLLVAHLGQVVEVAVADVDAVEHVAAPAVARSRQPMMLSSVVLPEPDGPVTTVNSPRSTARSTPRSAGTSVLPSW